MIVSFIASMKPEPLFTTARPSICKAASLSTGASMAVAIGATSQVGAAGADCRPHRAAGNRLSELPMRAHTVTQGSVVNQRIAFLDDETLEDIGAVAVFFIGIVLARKASVSSENMQLQKEQNRNSL